MNKFTKHKAEISALDKIIKPFSGCAEDWFLITAGSGTDAGQWNTMTAAWGGFGFLWQKPVAHVYIRPVRFTAEFTEREDSMTLSFFNSEDKKMRKALETCGRISGRTHDKAKEAGLTPILLDGGLIGFQEARLILECRKLYKTEFIPDEFLAAHIILNSYPERDFHYMYICEILSFYTAEPLNI